MLKKKRLTAYFRSWTDHTLLHLRNFCAGSEAEELHHLRVAIKRTRAIAYLLPKEQRTAANRLLRPLFRQAGEIRSAYMHLQLFRQFKITDAAIVSAQQQLIARKTKQMKRKYSAFVQQVLAARALLLTACSKTNDEDIRELYEHYLKKAGDQLEQQTSYHDARKFIKIVIYIHEALSKKVRRHLKVDLDYLHHMQANLGLWHDKVLSAEVVRESTGKGNRKLDKEVKAIVTQIHADSRKFGDKARMEKK